VPPIFCYPEKLMQVWSNLIDNAIQAMNYNRYFYELAESVEEAWEVIEELYEEGIRIIIVISDWLMPGIKGDEFLIQIHRRFPDIVTIMLTGQADEAAIERTRRLASLHACITKPWSERTLIGKIKSGLAKANR
jgi:response regulator RpfG family c-di-GMP phosphodiesterase